MLFYKKLLCINFIIDTHNIRQSLIQAAINYRVGIDEDTFKDSQKLSSLITVLAEKSGVRDNFTTVVVKLN